MTSMFSLTKKKESLGLNYSFLNYAWSILVLILNNVELVYIITNSCYHSYRNDTRELQKNILGKNRHKMNESLNVKETYETVCLTKLLSIDRLIGCLLEVNARMLGLNGS